MNSLSTIMLMAASLGMDLPRSPKPYESQLDERIQEKLRLNRAIGNIETLEKARLKRQRKENK